MKTPTFGLKVFVLVVDKYCSCIGLDFWGLFLDLEEKFRLGQEENYGFCSFLKGKCRSRLNPGKCSCVWVKMNPNRNLRMAD